MGAKERRRQGVQLSFLCPCGRRIALKGLGRCSCYDQRHHSLRFFGGLRERVLEHDRFHCCGCGQRSPLVVYHRDQHNPANLLVTSCIHRHMRIHRSSGWKCWFSEMPLRLWRELHPNVPMQLQLALRNAEKEGKSKALFKAPTGKVLPLLTWPNASAAGLIGALADAEESSTARETRFKV
jgi:hypothetical protein